MVINIANFATKVSFGAVKFLLHKLNYFPMHESEILALRVLMPFCEKIENERIHASLTNNIPYQDQIRFFLKEKIIKDFALIGLNLAKKHPDLEINIFNSSSLDAGSQCFFDVIGRIETISVSYFSKRFFEIEINDRSFLSEIEFRIDMLLWKNITPTKDESFFLIDAACRYLCAGDGWTSETILKYLLDHGVSDSRLYSYLGRALVMQSKCTEGEYYLNLAFENGDDLNKILTLYSLSMLYLRHHASYLQDLIKAKRFLTIGYDIIVNSSAEKLEFKDFHEVFNRNGYALVLFKEGKIQEAIKLLNWGIQKLETSKRVKDNMHQSVLIYNLALCYKGLNDVENCILSYKRLINIDPKDAQYKADLAELFMNNDDFFEAKKYLLEAFAIHPESPRINYLLETCLSGDETASLESRINCLKIAYQTDSNNYDIVYNCCTLLVEGGQYSEALRVLKTIDFFELSQEQAEDFISLKAECYLNSHMHEEAMSELRKMIFLMPENKKLNNNLNFILNKRDCEQPAYR